MMQTHADSTGSEAALARRLMRLADRAALATTFVLGEPGSVAPQPYASFVLLASDLDGSPILMLSDLADHSRNLHADPKAALLLAPAAGAAEPLAEPRLTLIGELRADGQDRLKGRFLDRHPGAALYASFADFRCYRMAVRKGHLVAGFGRIRWLKEGSLLLGPQALSFWPEEGNRARRMNVDEPDLMERLGAQASGVSAPWRLTGIDPEGCDFRAGERTARLSFAEPAGSVEAALERMRFAGGVSA
jgi:heme oxygenase (biliverdin-IX-beta and delta-forming)